MHPNAYLKTYWQMELRPVVFVAMSFAPEHNYRFYDVIVPAVERLSVDGVQLKAYRADISQTGDSILTDIINGVCHSQLVLADVSSVGVDKTTGQPYRNGNVMYEVGLALACRQPADVLLIRDDADKFLFDVSTIPHLTVDFSDKSKAIDLLLTSLKARIGEQTYIKDARVQIIASTLGSYEIGWLKHFQTVGQYVENASEPNLFWSQMMRTLTEKQLVVVVGYDANGTETPDTVFAVTAFGKAVLAYLNEQTIQKDRG